MGNSEEELELDGADLEGLDQELEVSGINMASLSGERLDNHGSPGPPPHFDGYKEDQMRHGGDNYGQMLTLCSDDDEGEEIELDPPGEDDYYIASNQQIYCERDPSLEESVEGGLGHLPRGGSLGELLDEAMSSPSQHRMQPGGRVRPGRPRSAVNPRRRKSSAHKRVSCTTTLAYGFTCQLVSVLPALTLQ
eukprot:6932703-Pyramimonas_sp.AAC.2